MKATQRDPLLATLDPLIVAIGATVIDPDHIRPGDVTLEVDGVMVAAIRLPALHGALERMIEAVERELGGKLSDLSRTNAVRSLCVAQLKTSLTQWASHESLSITISTHCTASYLEFSQVHCADFVVCSFLNHQ
jgi:hypothetical protein